MVQDHDVLVAKARYCQEKSGLICIHEGFDLVFRDENVVLFLVGNVGWYVFGRFSHNCRAGSLALAAHVPLLSFLGFREVLGDVFYIDEWPAEINSFTNSLEPGGFCWEARHTMEVPNG